MTRMSFALSLILALILGAVVLPPPASAAICRTVTVNDKGTSNAAITIDATAGGVTVLDAKTMRCGAVIYNSGTADMRCAPTTVTVTSTVGGLVPAKASIILGAEAAQAWKCIRTGASSTTADVWEATP